MSTTVAPPSKWIDAATARQQFGLTKTTLYQLRRSGRVVSSSVKAPGKSRGKRLYQVASIEAVIAAGIESSK